MIQSSEMFNNLTILQGLLTLQKLVKMLAKNKKSNQKCKTSNQGNI